MRIIHRALDAGINTIDTADVYSSGESESHRRQGARRPPRRRGAGHEVLLADGRRTSTSRGCRAAGSCKRSTNSLRRLGTDYIDIYYMHKPDLATDIEESLAAMHDLVAAGKIRTVAVSTFPADRIVEAQWAASQAPPDATACRAAAVLDLRARHRTRRAAGLRPLRHGRLRLGPAQLGLAHRQVRRGRPDPAGSRAQRWSANQAKNWNDERTPVQRKHDLVDALSGVAARQGCPSRISRWPSATNIQQSRRRSSGRARWSNSTTC